MTTKGRTEKSEFTQDKITKAELVKYEKECSETKLKDKIAKSARKIGAKLLYKVLQLWYVTKKPEVPAKIKVTIYGAIGYLIAPLDFLPDLLPLTGYTDDLAAVVFALSIASVYIDEEIRAKAKKDLVKIFGEEVLAELD